MFKKEKTKCYDDIIAIHLLLLQYVPHSSHDLEELRSTFMGYLCE
jgi:hypothetical protein